VRLSDEFSAASQKIGRVIISQVRRVRVDIDTVVCVQLALPDSAKTYKPRDMGGVAGGQKYLESGVFFKFARDAFGLYNGDEFAMKAAAHELSGLSAYLRFILEYVRAM
jgi:hypothetical protein